MLHVMIERKREREYGVNFERVERELLDDEVGRRGRATAQHGYCSICADLVWPKVSGYA